MYAFRSSYVPLAFAIANTERNNNYEHLTRTLLKVACQIGHDFQPKDILQWHGDTHKGIEAARSRVAPDSCRLSDWAHVTGATSQGAAGLRGLLLEHVSSAGKKAIVPFVLQWSRISKTMPKFLFHVIWQSIFAKLREEDEGKVVTALQG